MDWHRPTAAGLALIAALVALWSATVAPAQAPPAPSDAEIRAALREDIREATRALNRTGLERLREDGRYKIRVEPLVAGKVTARVKGKSFTAAYGERTVRNGGSYRVTLRVTRDGRRYLAANPKAKLQLKIDFRAAGP